MQLSKQQLERMNHISQANQLAQQTNTVAQAGAMAQKIFYPPEVEEFSKYVSKVFVFIKLKYYKMSNW